MSIPFSIVSTSECLFLVKKNFGCNLISLKSLIIHVDKFASPYLDPCKKKLCEFFSKCIKKSDGKAECTCPVCDDSKNGYSPVCGYDGKTYASQCELEKASCEKKTDIKVAKREACGKI